MRKSYQQERRKIISEIQETDCTRALHNHQHNLVFRVCECEKLLEEMAIRLEHEGRMMGFGGVHDEIVAQLDRLSEYHRKKLSTLKHGTLFDHPYPVPPRPIKTKESFGGKIFGRSQQEIASMQGSKEPR